MAIKVIPSSQHRLPPGISLVTPRLVATPKKDALSAAEQLFKEVDSVPDRFMVTSANFVRDYYQSAPIQIEVIRDAITCKLMEIATCGDTKYELRAIELLGKHVDVGLFTERSEVTIKNRNPEELEEAIRERLNRLANVDIINVTPRNVSVPKH